jgi:hypothetical protein
VQERELLARRLNCRCEEFGRLQIVVGEYTNESGRRINHRLSGARLERSLNYMLPRVQATPIMRVNAWLMRLLPIASRVRADPSTPCAAWGKNATIWSIASDLGARLGALFY